MKPKPSRTLPTLPTLPKYNEGIAAALLAAREAVMSPIRPILRHHELTEQQWRLLRVLIDHWPMEVSQAADASMIMAPSVTRILKDLTQRGLVQRTASEDDARRSILSITKQGNELVMQTAAETTELLAEYVAAFGKTRFDKLVAELKAFDQAIRFTR
ncbi:MAG: homoprotocatechuate degradation operon regulator HpaR [Pseudomonadota bacterium]